MIGEYENTICFFQARELYNKRKTKMAKTIAKTKIKSKAGKAMARMQRGRKTRDFQLCFKHALKALVEKAEAAFKETEGNGIEEWKAEFLKGRMAESVKLARDAHESQRRAFDDMDAFLAHWLGREAEAEIAAKGKAVAFMELYEDVRDIQETAKTELMLIPLMLKGRVKLAGTDDVWRFNWHFLVEEAKRMLNESKENRA